MIGVYVKVDGETYRLDLFQDETIDITSSQQDINDISKVFTDYSQDFSIPATANNNKVFKYWYENALENGYDDSTKLNCYIELNGNTFRSGKLKLVKANIVNGVAKDYSVSFFGNLVSLKDKFKDDKLINVTEINEIINFEYSAANVIDLVANANTEDIAFPLIAPSRVWTYGDSSATDINTSAGGIKYDELFPAVRVSKMFDAIAQKYSINFVGSFLEDKRFTELFLLAKNSDTIKFNSGIKDVSLTTLTGDDVAICFTFDYVTNTINYQSQIVDGQTSMFMNITTASGTNWTAYVYRDGVKFMEYTGVGTGSFQIFFDSTSGGIGNEGAYTFKFQTDGTITDAKIDMYVSYDDDPYTPGFEVNLFAQMGLNVYGASILPINVLMPDIKVADFFSGILKMFNLTCYSEDGFDFIIQPLMEWYADGGIVDITKYCEPNWDVNPTKQYKSIMFKYEKSDSVLNDKFYQVFQRYYGDLDFKINEEGEEYKVELPFEDLLHMKFSGTRLHVGFNVNKDLKSYTPKPILLYKYGNISTYSSYYIETQHKTSYNAFGQDLEYTEGVFYTLNWYAENSSLLDGVVENTLYKVYYESYLQSSFYTKARIINTKGLFNLNTILTLKLNDKVVIRDKRYRINKLNTNLNKQTFNLELITDL